MAKTKLPPDYYRIEMYLHDSVVSPEVIVVQLAQAEIMTENGDLTLFDEISQKAMFISSNNIRRIVVQRTEPSETTKQVSTSEDTLGVYSTENTN